MKLIRWVWDFAALAILVIVAEIDEWINGDDWMKR